MTDDQKTIYAIGLSMSQSLSSLDLSPAEVESSNAHSRMPPWASLPKPEEYPKFQTFSQSRSARSRKQKIVAKAY